MKRNLKVKMGEQKLRVEWDRLNAKYKKTKTLLAQALSHHHRFEQAVKAAATHDGTCWCGVTFSFKIVLHTAVCDDLFLALYGAERGE